MTGELKAFPVRPRGIQRVVMNVNISENRPINRCDNSCAGCYPVSDDFHSEPIQRKVQCGIADTEPRRIWAGISSDSGVEIGKHLSGVMNKNW